MFRHRASAPRNRRRPCMTLRREQFRSPQTPQRYGVTPWFGGTPSCGGIPWSGATLSFGAIRWFGATPWFGAIRLFGATPSCGATATAASKTPTSKRRQLLTRENTMPKNAKAYIALVIASGTTLLLLAAGSWSSASLRQFAIYLGLAALASTLKVRVPGIEGTMSPNFVFILLGVVTRSFSEVVAIGLTAALVQTLWASSKRPRMIQTAFNAAALIVSAGAAYKFSHAAGAADGAQAAVAGVILAGSVYFPLNSALVSIVV